MDLHRSHFSVINEELKERRRARKRKRERHQINNYWCYFFLFLYFDRKLISCLPRFGIGSHLILICLGEMGRQWERIIPEHSEVNLDYLQELHNSMWRSDFKVNGTSVTPFPLLSSHDIWSVKGYAHTTSWLLFTQCFKCNHIRDWS